MAVSITSSVEVKESIRSFFISDFPTEVGRLVIELRGGREKPEDLKEDTPIESVRFLNGFFLNSL